MSDTLWRLTVVTIMKCMSKLSMSFQYGSEHILIMLISLNYVQAFFVKILHQTSLYSTVSFMQTYNSQCVCEHDKCLWKKIKLTIKIFYFYNTLDSFVSFYWCNLHNVYLNILKHLFIPRLIDGDFLSVQRKTSVSILWFMTLYEIFFTLAIIVNIKETIL